MIGRKNEKKELLKAYSSEFSEFVAVYGRRRVGKTFLVRETFDYKFTFQHAGLKKKSTSIQLDRFRQSLVECGYRDCPDLQNWYKAFDALKVVIEQSLDSKKVVFIDEMPWMDRPNANFLSALENFWNAWASARKDILLIVCGSAASWVLKRVVYNKEGLHNRVTYRIPLLPFSLKECEEYAESQDLNLNREQLAECYMVLGGIPYYWHFLDKGLSVAQNVDELFFAGHDKLENEFDELYASLFSVPKPYLKVITALGRVKSGMTRDEIAKSASLANNGALTKRLRELEQCGFVRKFVEIGRKNRGSLYQLIDNYTLFYFRFASENRLGDRHFWSEMLDSHIHSTWIGLAFERLCLQHADQIKEALRIGGVHANIHSWHNAHAQVDLLIDRNDGIVNLCEMKYHDGLYTIEREVDEAVRNKKSEFKEETGTHKAVHVVFVTPYGVKPNAYSKNVQAFVQLDDLFCF